MGNIGDPITSGSIPAVGAAGTAYASNINLFLTEIKNRLEAKVPKTSIADGVLDMNGSGINNNSYLGVANGTGVPSTPLNSVQAYGNDLYWVSTAGTVKITSGSTLNAGSIGGITGDYGGVNPAQFRFVDADQEYYAYDDYAGGAWAYIWAKGVDFAKNATSTTRTRVISDSTMASSYTYTLPAAVPGTPSIIQMSTGGVTSANNTLAAALTAQEFKHTGSLILSIPGHWRDPTIAHAMTANGASITSSTQKLWLPITLPVGSHISGMKLFVHKVTAGTDTIQVDFVKMDNTTGVITSFASASSNANNPGYIALTNAALNTLTLANLSYLLQFTPGGTAGNDIFGAEITYDRP